MTETSIYDDEILTAFLDNEVDAETKAAIETALKSDASLKDRLASLEFPIKSLNIAASNLLDAAPAAPDFGQTVKQPRRFRPQLVAWVACLVFGVAIGTSWIALRPHQPNGWRDYVAAYQALYVNETLASVATTPEAASANLTSLGATLGLDLSGAQFDPGLRFKRGQILGFQGKALVQLAYLNALGEPVALCIIRGEDAGLEGISVTTLEGMAAAFWERDGFAYLLIGGTDEAFIASTAESMAKRL